jgi:hypothetical protein
MELKKTCLLHMQAMTEAERRRAIADWLGRVRAGWTLAPGIRSALYGLGLSKKVGLRRDELTPRGRFFLSTWMKPSTLDDALDSLR